MDVIDDPGDPRLADIRDLRKGPGPRRESALDWFVIEGTLALERAVSAGHRLRSVVVTEERIEALEALAIDPGAPRIVVTRACLAQVTGFDAHRGILASADRPEPLGVGQVLAQGRRFVAVEAVNDLENLGAVFRVAAALGMHGVLLDPRCADPLYRRCVRVSLGWSTAVPFAVAASSGEVLASLNAAGITTVALTPSGAVAVDDAAQTGLLDDPFALIVGAEGPGLEPATLAGARHRVAIPMQDEVDSLNVATSLAVVAAFAAACRSWRS